MRVTDYNAIADTYDRRYSEEDYDGIERALVDFVADMPRDVLEVGCGTGHWLQALSAMRFRVVGVDASQRMLSKAKSKLETGRLVRGCAEHLPFSNDTFERIFCINAHHHFLDKQLFVAEARRVLKSGGKMFLAGLDPHSGTDRWWIYDYFETALELDRERYPSCEQLRRWMEEAGFTNIETAEVMHSPGDVAAREALEKNLLARDQLSSLAMLTEREYDAGLRRIRKALEADAALRLFADLRVYATYGVVP